MPYLNWKSASIDQEVASHHDREFQLQLKLGSDSVQQLLPCLEEVFSQEGAELRLDLPKEWIIFWKRREGESRLLIAHPQPEEWVTTLALSQAHCQLLVEGLRALKSGETLAIGGLPAPQAAVSNVEVLISIV